MRSDTWVNSDGLQVGFGARTSKNPHGATVRTEGNVEILTLILDWDQLPPAATTAPIAKSIPVPADSVILRGNIRVTDDFTSGGAATVDIGFIEADGTAIDQDGLLAAQAIGGLTEGDVVEFDGDLVGDNVGGDDAYISVNVNVDDLTGGRGIVTVEYLRPMPDSEAQDPITGTIGSL